MAVPANPKIYHIAHVDRLPSIIADNGLFSDAKMNVRPSLGTMIGMGNIKRRRLEELTLTSHPDLYVGQCVPFYLCPRSVMLYIIFQTNSPGIQYHGGQLPIMHLEFDMRAVVQWGQQNNRKWAFTTSNAGSHFFDDYNDLNDLDVINWDAVRTNFWSSCKDAKQSEFLIEESLPWVLVERIGVIDQTRFVQVNNALTTSQRKPPVEILKDWYY